MKKEIVIFGENCPAWMCITHPNFPYRIHGQAGVIRGQYESKNKPSDFLDYIPFDKDKR